MSCWIRMVVVGLMGASGLALGQTRIGPGTVRIGEVGQRTSKIEEESKIEDRSSDKPGEPIAGEVTIVQMRRTTRRLSLHLSELRYRKRIVSMRAT